eukprot:250604_1
MIEANMSMVNRNKRSTTSTQNTRPQQNDDAKTKDNRKIHLTLMIILIVILLVVVIGFFKEDNVEDSAQNFIFDTLDEPLEANVITIDNNKNDDVYISMPEKDKKLDEERKKSQILSKKEQPTVIIVGSINGATS